MTPLRPAATSDPGRWLLRSDVDWWTLFRYGPPGFPAYCRIAFDTRPDGMDQDGEAPCLRAALATLARHTDTPDLAYAAIWEGWSGTTPAPEAPRLHLPERTMLLFTGPVESLRDAPAVAWETLGTTYQEPHLVWPQDQAWCLACEVDEEIEFTVGCDDEAAEALERALPNGVRRVPYGAPAPLYREPT